jgi:transposase-like protein
MKPISYARHRFPPDVIRHAVWLYLRFTLSYRDVEDLLAERGLIVSNEAIRRWVLKFGPVIAKNLRTSRPQAYTRWHLDEMVSRSPERKCTCGALSMVRVRFWKFLFNPSATRPRQCDCYANSFAARALSRRLSSPISCDLTGRPFARLAFRDCTSKACAPTTVQRTRTSRFEDENERCRASNQPNLLSASFRFMRRSTTHSMFNGIWSAAQHIDSFEPPRTNVGMRRQ